MIKFYNGHSLPQLGLGTFKMENDEETKLVIKQALEVGYRHFDTAQMYGNEKAIGIALNEANVDRNEIYLTTKLHGHHSKERTRELILDSLNKLQTDYLDLLLIHWPNHDDEINLQTWQVFEEMYQEGKLKAIGVSNFTRFQLSELLKRCTIKPMVNQVEMHPALQQIQMIDFCNKNDIVVTGYGPLMRGKMFDSPFIEVFDEIASKNKCTVGQVLIAWGLAKGIIMIPKTVNENRLIENFNAKNIKLTKEQINMIDSFNIASRLYTDPANNKLGKYNK